MTPQRLCASRKKLCLSLLVIPLSIDMKSGYESSLVSNSLGLFFCMSGGKRFGDVGIDMHYQDVIFHPELW
jgi:hypothetical protein